MALSVQCQECGTQYNVPDRLAGKKAKCKKCGATMSIPRPEAEIGFAPEDDSLSALQDLARQSGEDAGAGSDEAPDVAPAPAAARRRGAASSIPADWTPESVIIEKEAAPSPRSRGAEGSGRWARKSGGLFEGVLRKTVTYLIVCGVLAGGWYLYTHFSGRAKDLISSAKDKVTGGGKSADGGPADGSQGKPPPPPTETDRNREKSADNLRAIYRAVSAHFAKTNKSWPVDLAALQRDGSLTPEQVDSPFDPAFASADYVYKPYAPETPAGPEVVLAYDHAEYSNGEGANILFGGGEVRWLDRAGVEAALQQSETLRVAAVQQYEQVAAARRQLEMQRSQSTVVDGGAGQGAGDPRRPGGRGDLAERIKAGAKGMARDVQDVAVRRGTEQLVRPITPAAFVAVLVRGPQGDTVEVLDGKSAEPVNVAEFASDAQFRNNPGAYALSPDGKLVARLTSFPKLRAVVYSLERKTETQAIDLDENFGEPTIVGFLAADKFVVRWHKFAEYGFEVWDARTGKRGRQVPLFRVDPQPSPGGEAVSPDGRTYAVVNRAPPPRTGAAAPRGRAAEAGLQVLLYDVLAGPTQPRRFNVPVLNNQPGVTAAGLAFSPDKQRLALLLLDAQGRSVVVTWNVATGKPLPEKTLPDRLDPPRVGLGRARMLDWVADGRALLIAGRMVLNPDTGEILAVFDAGKVHGQAVTNDSTVHLAYGEAGTQLDGVAVITLEEAKFPEKPGAPNRAVAAPTK